MTLKAPVKNLTQVFSHETQIFTSITFKNYNNFDTEVWETSDVISRGLKVLVALYNITRRATSPARTDKILAKQIMVVKVSKQMYFCKGVNHTKVDNDDVKDHTALNTII